MLPKNRQFIGSDLLGQIQPPLAQPDQGMKEENGLHASGSEIPEQIATPDVGQFMSQHHRKFGKAQPTERSSRNHDSRAKDADEHGTAVALGLQQYR